jgi:hypothetical protein
MICSILSHRKDIVALVTVKNLTAPYLKDITMHVIKMVEKAGLRIVCLISDNNLVNGNMFRLLCGSLLQPCIDYPCDNSRKLFSYLTPCIYPSALEIIGYTKKTVTKH